MEGQGREIQAVDHVVDHALQAHGGAVFRGVDLGYAIAFKLPYLVGDNDPATAAEHLDMRGASLGQEVDHVFKRLHVSALIAGHGDALDILLDGCIDQFLNRSVVGQMDDLDSGILQDPPHDVGRHVVTVKKGCRSYYPDTVLWSVWLNFRMHILAFRPFCVLNKPYSSG